MTPAGFAVEEVEGVPVVRAAGEIDLTNVRDFEHTLELAARADRGAVVLALDQTTYLDSQGVRVLLQVAGRLSVTRQQLVLVAARGTIARRILELTGVEHAWPVLETFDEAIEIARRARFNEVP
jgi:anti-anti-sigma factor